MMVNYTFHKALMFAAIASMIGCAGTQPGQVSNEPQTPTAPVAPQGDRHLMALGDGTSLATLISQLPTSLTAEQAKQMLITIDDSKVADGGQKTYSVQRWGGGGGRSFGGGGWGGRGWGGGWRGGYGRFGYLGYGGYLFPYGAYGANYYPWFTSGYFPYLYGGYGGVYNPYLYYNPGLLGGYGFPGVGAYGYPGLGAGLPGVGAAAAGQAFGSAVGQAVGQQIGGQMQGVQPSMGQQPTTTYSQPTQTTTTTNTQPEASPSPISQ